MKTESQTLSSTIAVPARTAELCSILRDLLNAQRRLGDFFPSTGGKIMNDLPDRYMDADGKLGAAIATLFEYVGIYLQDDFK